EALSRGRDGRTVFPRPQAETAHWLEQRMSELRQRVFDAGRNGWEHRARDQAVTFQRQGQHSLRNAAEWAADLVEPFRPVAERAHDQHCPFVTDAREYLAHGAAIFGLMQVTR